MHLMHHASFCASACKVVRLVYLVFDDGKIDLVVVSESRLTFIQLSPIGTDARVSTGREDFHREDFHRYGERARDGESLDITQSQRL
jgi:hypothetical protein